jgi:2-polyprenyl-6-hydroxyphenyl methylase/3-demethylubiquinone-9 3-methyltransferase
VPTPAPDLSAFIELFAAQGGTETAYLRDHYPRFVATRERVLANWNGVRGARILDVGAHWLHQALLYALDGHAVTALDVPATMDAPEVRALAAAHAIELLPNPDLEHPHALAAVADDTFDLVLLTEVIEHLAFNPVAMWREIYRVMKPGARIVVTTPNFYALRATLRRWLRALHLRGGGVAVDQILMLNTFGHHWKEYSRRELTDYFALLSPDFRCRNVAYTHEYLDAVRKRPGAGLLLAVEAAIPPLRPDLYVEVDLVRKEKGIAVEPHW